jgi:hypothetical protein
LDPLAALRAISHILSPGKRIGENPASTRDILYGELTSRNREKGSPFHRYKDVCKCDLKALDINKLYWEELAKNKPKWKQFVKADLNKLQDAGSSRECKQQKEASAISMKGC